MYRNHYAYLSIEPDWILKHVHHLCLKKKKTGASPI